ncbi:ABC-three component system middle component 1 [Sorangium sp. So ce291]|uniref:ABC-three component system middle component 1 n=1 Tax=Sorangium sp. So ce291 TaxID=3133294 RepID=UPI003F62627A
MFVDVYSVLVASLGDDREAPDEIGQHLFQYLERAAKVRTWLDAARKENLYLFLVGPRGSTDLREWRDVQHRIERDERICRKLVWLPPEEESLLERDARRFCERTFMARPWKGAFGDAEELDPLRVVLAAAQVPVTWYDVLESPNVSDRDIAELLVSSIPSTPGKK